MARFIAIILFAGLCASMSVYGAYVSGFSKGYLKKEVELKECAEEVSQGCPNVTSYAVLLEEENARLNKICKKSKP